VPTRGQRIASAFPIQLIDRPVSGVSQHAKKIGSSHEM